MLKQCLSVPRLCRSLSLCWAHCSTGNRAAKVLVRLGAGAGSTVIGVRFKDAASGEVIAGFHHRVVSGTSWSTTGSKFFKWVRKSGKELAGGLEAAYRKGDLQKM